MSTSFDLDYDLDCLSNGEDLGQRFSFNAKRDPESAFTGMATRFGSRFSNFTRWRPSKRSTLMASPTCEMKWYKLNSVVVVIGVG